jgi:hypothetical protein
MGWAGEAGCDEKGRFRAIPATSSGGKPDAMAEQILDESSVAPAVRLFFGAAALIPATGVWDLVFRPWPQLLSPVGVLFLVLGAVATGMVVFLAGVAVLGPGRRLEFDSDAGYLRDHLVIGGRDRLQRVTDLRRLRRVEIVEDHDTDGPPRLALKLWLAGRRSPVVLLYRPMGQRAALDRLAADLTACASQP